MRVYLTSYATERFQGVQCDLNVSAIQFGIPNILSYTDLDLRSSEYYGQNRSILDEVCGAGYWAWKPYFIIEALSHLQDDDILFYCDAGSLFVASPDPLIELCSRHPQGIILFDARPLTNHQFSKRDCFVRMGCDEPKYWNHTKVIATILLLRKCIFTLSVLREWLHYCCDRAVITNDPSVCGLPELPGFLQHRNDQAILSVLATKHALETFRNPTLWGNFLKLAAFRVPGEPVVSPYNLLPEIRDYAEVSQQNSPYGTIFVINRLPNWVGKKPLPTLTKSPPVSLARRMTLWAQRRLL